MRGTLENTVVSPIVEGSDSLSSGAGLGGSRVSGVWFWCSFNLKLRVLVKELQPYFGIQMMSPKLKITPAAEGFRQKGAGSPGYNTHVNVQRALALFDPFKKVLTDQNNLSLKQDILLRSPLIKLSVLKRSLEGQPWLSIYVPKAEGLKLENRWIFSRSNGQEQASWWNPTPKRTEHELGSLHPYLLGISAFVAAATYNYSSNVNLVQLTHPRLVLLTKTLF